MDREKWSKLKEIFAQAEALEPGEREAFVSEAAEGDAELAVEGASLLSSRDETANILEANAFDLSNACLRTKH
ncbi:MAG: hypothetical protein IPM21_12020 [Acidobacteria bacterium]|nr:hypothetical protein [Acidobacteriota bacterium]